MNERNMPIFNKHTIMHRIYEAESRRQKELLNDPVSLELIANTVIKLANECNLIREHEGYVSE